jgi:beta-glucanase (GH16 family)
LADTGDMKQRRMSGLLMTMLVLGGLSGLALSALAICTHHDRQPRGSSASAAIGPSGVAMPTASVSGWRVVFADDFTGSALYPGRWHKYNGQPGGDPAGWFDSTHVSVSNGEVVIGGYRDPGDGGKWTTGGVGTTLAQAYGKYLVRFRFDAGTGVAHAILLWPADERWPPEVDFSEDNGGNKQMDYATLHYAPDNTMLQRHIAVDITQWHTLGVEWTPGRLVYTLDGVDWATVISEHVPSIPMVLGMQTQAWASGDSTWEHGVDAKTPTHVNLYVDWVVAYAPA